jgi:hypothetical protein
LRQQENILQVAQRFAARGVPQAVIADLVKAGRQDVLEEAPDELVAGHGFLALAVGGAVLVAIGQVASSTARMRLLVMAMRKA